MYKRDDFISNFLYLLSSRVHVKEQWRTTNLCTLFVFWVKSQTLYSNGSRNFWIHGTGALGCLPQKLAIPRKNDSDLDQYGCLKTYNRAAVAFNAALGSLCDELSAQMKDATLVYTDLFPIKYGLVANHTKYGERTKHVRPFGKPWSLV